RRAMRTASTSSMSMRRSRDSIAGSFRRHSPSTAWATSPAEGSSSFRRRSFRLTRRGTTSRMRSGRHSTCAAGEGPGHPIPSPAMPTSLTRLEDNLLDAPVAGSGLHEDENGHATLRAQLDSERPTLLLFLRHLGCVFCRQMVKDVRIASDEADAGQAEKRFPRVVFVHSAETERGARFFG